MASPFTDFYAGLVAAIYAALPAVDPANGGGGAWTAMQLQRQPLDQTRDEHGFPFVVIHVTRYPAAEWGAANDAYQPVVEFYLAQNAPEDDTGLTEDLEALKDYLRANDPAGGQTYINSEISTSPAMVGALNRLISKQTQAAVGRLTQDFIVGTTP